MQSLLAGLDVARRALDPRLPVDPGLLRQPTALAVAVLIRLAAVEREEARAGLHVDRAAEPAAGATAGSDTSPEAG
jgi:multisubunit Na+/H+ antiporter MnhE subunit